jgi:hypothetical protein
LKAFDNAFILLDLEKLLSGNDAVSKEVYALFVKCLIYGVKPLIGLSGLTNWLLKVEKLENDAIDHLLESID